MLDRAAFCLGVASLLLSAAAPATAPSREKLPWPPTGPSWETDPATAFTKARAEKKAVFVYVATEG